MILLLPNQATFIRTLSAPMLALVPQLAFASTPPSTFAELVNLVIGVINLLIPLLFITLFVYLVWKVIDAWIINVADEKKRSDGKAYAVAAVVVLVLAVSVWGIVNLLRRSVFGF